MTAGGRITAYITNTHAPMTHYVTCPVCGGRVGFNLEELRTSGNKSVYCAGPDTPTTGGTDPHNHWHPPNALTDAGPVEEFHWAKPDDRSEDERDEEQDGDQPEPQVEEPPDPGSLPP